MIKVKKLSKTIKLSRKSYKKKKIRPEIIGLIIVVVIGGLALLTIVLIIAINQIAQYNLQREIGEAAKVARVKHLPLNETAHQQKVDTIKSLGVVDESVPILSERLDTCILISSVQGWVNTDWRQKCFTEYTDYLPTASSKDIVVTKLVEMSGINELFDGTDNREITIDCKIYERKNLFSIRYFSPTEGNDRCRTFRYTSNGGDDSIFKESRGETFVIKSFDNNNFIKSAAYIKIESRKEYYESKSLGCSGFIMCSPPIESAISSFK